MSNRRLYIYSIATRIREEIFSRFSPGERLPSEQQLSDELGESYNRIHRAMQLLRSDGFITSGGFRQGYLLCTREKSLATIRKSTSATLSISLPLIPESAEAQQWRHICDMFSAINPGVTFEYRYGVCCGEADIQLTWPPLHSVSPLLPLDASELLSAGEFPSGGMHPGLLVAGFQFGRQYAIPVAYAPAVYWGHRNLLRHQQLFVEEFREPLDYYRWGEQLFRNRACPLVLAFIGPSYHASPWGVEYHREGDFFRTDPARLKFFLESVKPYLHLEGMLFSMYNAYELFRRGSIALLPNFLSRLSLTEHRFQLLGHPLLPGGFVNQAVFLLALGRTSLHTEWGKEFIRFALTRQAQETLASPVSKLSVWHSLDAEQRERILKLTGVNVPPFDPRGLFAVLDFDFELLVGIPFQQACQDYFLEIFSLESTLRKLSEFHIPTLWRTLAPDLHEEKVRTHREFLASRK